MIHLKNIQLNDLKTYDIDPTEIHITREMIARLIGADPDNIPEPYDEIIDTELEKIKNYNDIRGGYRIISDIELNKNGNSIVVENKQFMLGRQVFMYVKNAEMMIFFVCTAGESVGKRSKDLMAEGFMLEGYVTDVVGSTLVEKAMDQIHQKITEEMNNRNLFVTNRYSPGYCEWNVNDQHKLFELFPDSFCGVRLSENAMMHPVKSISGIIGIGKNVNFNKYVCESCTSVNCLYRNTRHTV